MNVEGRSRSTHPRGATHLGIDDVEPIPTAWRRYIVPQRHAAYTPAQHETWRRLIARTAHLVDELGPRLHPAYVGGFRDLVMRWKTIPRLSEINAALAPFGWQTVCVDGYIPPDVYAGLLAVGSFPVSRGIRRPEHVDFSPAPDLAHDLLGHLPMLVSPDHRQFLRRLATAMSAVQGNALDRQLYLANRAMSTLRSHVRCQHTQLELAEARVRLIQESLANLPSALTHLGRLYLWSIEFGLMGTARDYLIYGAGLLSSTAEARTLCSGGGPIQELSVSAVERDIRFSDMQSTYFVASSYAALDRLLTHLQRRWTTATAEKPHRSSRA